MNRGSGCCRPLPYHLAIAPRFRFCEYATINHKNEKILPPLLQELVQLIQNDLKIFQYNQNKLLERITRLELATSTLARWRSTR